MSKRSLLLAFKLAQKLPPIDHSTLPPGSIRHPEELPPPSLAPVSQDSKPRVGKDGIKRFHNSFGKLHRMDGPAVISPDGNNLWFQNNELHREDGPAAVFFNGTERWYMKNHQLTSLEVLQFMINKGKLSTHDIDTLKELAEIAFFDYAKTDVKALKQAGSILQERGLLLTRNIHTITDFLKASQKL